MAVPPISSRNALDPVGGTPQAFAGVSLNDAQILLTEEIATLPGRNLFIWFSTLTRCSQPVAIG
jgi:hypothetical protein